MKVKVRYTASDLVLASVDPVSRNVGRPVTILALLGRLVTGMRLLAMTGSRGGIAAAAPSRQLFLVRYLSQSGRDQSTRLMLSLGLVAAVAVVLPQVQSSGLLDVRLLDRFSTEQIETGSCLQDLWRDGMLAAGDATQDMYFFPYNGLVLGLCAAAIRLPHFHCRVPV